VLPILAVAAATMVSGCSNAAPETGGTTNDTPSRSAEQSGEQGDLTIAVVTHGQAGDAFWDIVKSGADQAGRDESVTVTYAGDGDPARQSQLIDNAVAREVDGLVVSMANPDGVRDRVE
jgi:simple sugar transport system substrate-binding protein